MTEMLNPIAEQQTASMAKCGALATRYNVMQVVPRNHDLALGVSDVASHRTTDAADKIPTLSTLEIGPEAQEKKDSARKSSQRRPVSNCNTSIPHSSNPLSRPKVHTSPQFSLPAYWEKMFQSVAAQGRRFGMRPDPKLAGRWRDLNHDEKFLQAARACEERRGRAFTLNLSKEVESEARRQDNPAGYLAERIAKQFRKKKISDLPYAFKLEISKAGRLHLHGVLYPHSAESDLVKAAFMDAGGSVPPRSRPRQFSVRLFMSLRGAEGWVWNYLRKSARARRELSCKKVVFLSQRMTQLATAFHEGARSNTGSGKLAITKSAVLPDAAGVSFPSAHPTHTETNAASCPGDRDRSLATGHRKSEHKSSSTPISLWCHRIIGRPLEALRNLAGHLNRSGKWLRNLFDHRGKAPTGSMLPSLDGGRTTVHDDDRASPELPFAPHAASAES